MENDIKKRLFELADEKYHDFHSEICPGIDNIIGVRVPILRNYAKEIYNKYDGNWQEVLENIDDEYYEEIMLQGMIIGLAKAKNKQDIEQILKQITKFVPKIDNWAVCDTFCASLKITKKYNEIIWEFIQKYLRSNKEFEIRFAVVMILDYYINEEYLNKDFEIFDYIENDTYYVKMAIAWAISVCLVKYYDETIKYLKIAKLDDWTYNKSIQKAIESYRITDKQKEELRKIKKIFVKFDNSIL